MIQTVVKETLKKKIQRAAKIVLAENLFFDFCRVTASDFYKEDRNHLVKLCNVLDDFYRGRLKKSNGDPYKKIMINIPPQHGKTRTLVNFCKWALGLNPNEKVICGSYSSEPAGDFSRYTRDGITEDKIDPNEIVYSDIFPESKLKYGQSSYYKWALEGQHFTYLGAGVLGSITSKGATILMIDDPVKGALEALNKEYLKKIWLWYTGTFLSRVAAKGGEPLEIILMTRWSKDDLCGKILDSDFADDWYVLKMEAYDPKTDKMLCPDFLNKKRYKFLKKEMPEEIFEANYHQKTMDQKGRLYKSFKLYKDFPRSIKGEILFKEIKTYTDTADEGDDFLCSIIYGVSLLNEPYLLDVVYTKEAMEETEPKVAERLNFFKVNLSRIESNSGGRGFARNVKKHLVEDHKNKSTIIEWFHQSENKLSRILTNATFVQNHIYFPFNWREKWPVFYEHVTTFQREGKNQIDDAEDCLSGIAENFSYESYYTSISEEKDHLNKH